MTLDAKSEIAKAFRSLLAPDQVTEIRILGIGGRDGWTAAGWFNDPEAMTEEILKWEKKNPQGIYFIFNPLHEACLARTSNTIKERLRQTSSDRDVIARWWLPIDIDPVRPAGVSATKAELEAALAIAMKVVAFLKDMGFPDAVIVMSGNGIHILYRIDLPNDDASRDLVAGCLRALDAAFSNAAAKIDTSVSNAARIWKVPGTAARKGAHTQDRPHRRAHLIGDPPAWKDLTVVERSQLEALAALGPSQVKGKPPGKAKPSGSKTGAAAGTFDMEGFIAAHGIAVQRTEPWGGGIRYILEACLFDSSHVGTSAALGTGETGAPYYSCKHNSCSDKRWADVWALLGKKPATGSPASQPGASGPAEDPYKAAIEFLEHLHDSKMDIRHYRGEWWVFDGTHYHCTPPAEIETQLVRWHGPLAKTTTSRRLSDMLRLLAAISEVPGRMEMPILTEFDQDTWDIQCHEVAGSFISMANGLLDLDAWLDRRKECLKPHSPAHFDSFHVPYEFDPDANCPAWIEFLTQVLNDDEEAKQGCLLAEWFGYCLVRSCEHERILMIDGPPRSGKSTVLRMLGKLVGGHFSAPNLFDMATQFGLWSSLGARVIIMPDAHLGRGKDAMLALERLKSISGNDVIDIARKNLPTVRTRLHAKICIGVNELPKFADSPGALAKRLIIIPFPNSFDGREDRKLEAKLIRELPGIFQWACNGLRALRQRGDFDVPEGSKEICAEFARLGSPVQAFVEERCIVRPDMECYVDDLFEAWKSFCSASGHHPGSKDQFGLRLRRSAQRIKRVSARRDGEITRKYLGIGLRVVSSWV